MTGSATNLTLSDFLFNFNFFFWLLRVFTAVCGLSLAAVNEGYSLAAVHGLLTVAASPVVEHRLQGTQASVVVTLGLSCSKA